MIFLESPPISFSSHNISTYLMHKTTNIKTGNISFLNFIFKANQFPLKFQRLSRVFLSQVPPALVAELPSDSGL